MIRPTDPGPRQAPGREPTTGVPGARWYAVQLNPNKDALAAWHLQNQGFSVFAPRLQKTIRHARQFRSVTVPLFPGYLFVSIDARHDRWRAINGTLGVRSLVMSGDRPLPISEPTMAELRRQFADQSEQAPLRPGDAVEVTSGPLTGLVGKMQRLDGSARVKVLMDLLGAEIGVSLPRGAVVSRPG